MGLFRARKARRAALFALSGLAVAVGCGTNEGIVGGVCASGFTDCDGVCVAGGCGALADAALDAARDAARDRSVHDGTTSDVMAKADGDGSGLDGSRHRDAAEGDARTDGRVVVEGAAGDGTTGDAHERDGASRDGQTGSGDAGAPDAAGDSGAGDGAACAPPLDTVTHCGSCDVSCATGQVCAPVLEGGADAATFVCAPLCAPPYVDCGGTCVLFDDDPLNCGGCGVVCPSGICEAGMCVGGASGDLVVIGHDFAAGTVHSGEKEVLSNAVFLSGAAPTRVLSFEQYADATQVAHVKALLAATGRPIAFTVEDDAANVPGELTTASFDAFLVYDQRNAAPSGTLAMVGATLAAAIQSFTKSGGDVVVLDGASGVHEMAAFLTQSGVLATTADTAIANNTPLVNVAPGDAVGNGVILTYASVTDTVTFTTTQANGGSVTYVIEDSVGLAPVVIHETVN